MPPAKEIKYFTEEMLGIERGGLLRRLFSRHWLYRANRDWLWSSSKQFVKSLVGLNRPDLVGIKWCLRFVLGRRSDSWYRGLFSEYGGIADISPKYVELDESAVLSLDQRFPGLKVVMFVRNPIERDWSSARMILCKHKGRLPDSVSEMEFKQFFDRKPVIDQSNYPEYLPLWRKVFGDRLLVLFYDAIAEKPETLVNRVLGHIRMPVVDFNRLGEQQHSLLKSRVGQGVQGAMPEGVRKHLQSKHKATIVELQRMFPDEPWPKMWLDQFIF